MSAANSDTIKLAVTSRPRRGLVVVFFLCWTILAALTVWWLIVDAASSGNTVIRVGAEEAKSWSVRLHETVALARLNFPWALAWFLLTPYVLWVGGRHSFESARWRRQLPVLLATGAGFIWASQWLAERLVAGQTMVVMVKYTADTSVEKLHAPNDEPDNPLPRGFVTNHFFTNRFTKIMVSGETTHATNRAVWETTTSEILSSLATNLPHMLGGGFGGVLPSPGPVGPRRWSAVLDSLAYVALIGLAHAGVFYRRYREREQHAAVLASRLNEARLHALQAQLQPHFLFNTLNGIATLLRRDPVAAEEMLLSLSELLRAALGNSHRQEITLREEMDFLGRYLAIQRMRFGERLQVNEAIDPSALDCLVPALLLQPLVENAISHGLEPLGRPGELRIGAAREGHWLKLVVEDNGVGLPAEGTGRAGVGLANVRERLAALHGAAHEFSITERAQGGVIVNIKLPARVEAKARVAREETTA